MLPFLVCSDSLLGFIHQRDVHDAQHHVWILCENKQSICSLKLSLANLLLAIGSRGGVLNMWPGVKLQSQTLKITLIFLAVKVYEQGILFSQFFKLSY